MLDDIDDGTGEGRGAVPDLDQVVAGQGREYGVLALVQVDGGMEDESVIGRVGSLLLTRLSLQDVAIDVLDETEPEVRVVHISVPDPNRVG